MMRLTLFIYLLLVFGGRLSAQETATVLSNWHDSSLAPSANYANTYNEVWGYAVDGHEYAIIGSTLGTHFFEVMPDGSLDSLTTIVGALSGPAVVHRDFHDYAGYLYIVCGEDTEQSTLQIADLTQLPEGEITLAYDSNELFTRVHNIFIDTAQAMLYTCSAKRVNDETIVLGLFSLQDPLQPVWVSEFPEGGLVHDIYVRDGLAFINAANLGLMVVDFSDPTNPIGLGALPDYSAWGQGYNHSGWLTEDGRYYVMADENYGVPMKLMDVSEPADLDIISTISSEIDENSIVHNQMIKGDYLFTSYYHDGLQVFDISDPYQPQKVLSYNTYLPDDHASYRGAWGVYCYLPSGKILLSDMQTGLYVFADDLGIGNGSIVGEESQPIEADHSIQLFDQFIRFNAGKSLNGMAYEIYDLNGKMCDSGESAASGHIFEINIKNQLQQGMHILRIEAEGEKFSYPFLRFK